MQSQLFSTPILLLTFNRPDYVAKQIDILRSMNAPLLYIAGDGPRTDNDSDRIACRQVQETMSMIDWKCTIHSRFRTQNLGCKKAVIDAIDWFFSKEEAGIILEDDCLPDPTFFQYCQELLTTYKNNDEVAHISGFSFLSDLQIQTSFAFTRHPLCWGWATWKRSWKDYDGDMKDWPRVKLTSMLADIFPNKSSQRYWEKLFDAMYDQKVDTWDYQWVYTLFCKRTLAILPKTNLVTNIGFDTRATHTKIPFSPNARKSVLPLQFPLSYPEIIATNSTVDQLIQESLEHHPIRKLFSGLTQYFYGKKL